MSVHCAQFQITVQKRPHAIVKQNNEGVYDEKKNQQIIRLSK